MISGITEPGANGSTPRQDSWLFSPGESTNHRSHSPLLGLGLKFPAVSNFATGYCRAPISGFLGAQVPGGMLFVLCMVTVYSQLPSPVMAQSSKCYMNWSERLVVLDFVACHDHNRVFPVGHVASSWGPGVSGYDCAVTFSRSPTETWLSPYFTSRGTWSDASMPVSQFR
jgi:hypothetical protein